MGLKFGGVTYPLVLPADTLSLGRTCDPFAQVFLEFYQAVINHYCASAFTTAMAGQMGRAPDRLACLETTTNPPELYLRSQAYDPPFLALYPVQDDPEAMHTLKWSKTVSRYQLDYVLPPLDAETAERVLPILPAVRRLLVQVTRKLGDKNFDSGAEVMGLAGVMSAQFLSASYGFLPKDEIELFPALQMQMQVVHREDHDPSDDRVLDRIQTTIESEGATAFEIVSYSTPLGLYIMASLVLRLIGVDGVNVCDIAALSSGIRRVVGKSFDDASGAWKVTAEPGSAVCSGPELTNYRSFYAKACRLGELVPADPDTAAALGVPWTAPAKPAKPPSGGDK